MDNKETKEEVFKIPIEELFPKFKEHLEIKDNSRILFSGRFGIGKTYFLNDFFKNYQDGYEVFHFFPVNYQISANEDILEFLKYDILVELNKKNKDIFQKNDYSSLIDLQRLLFIWGKNNFNEIFKTGLSFIPRLGRPLKEVAGLVENFWSFKNEIEAGEKGFVKDFLEKTKKKNITETDYLSELLRKKIQTQKGNKQSVLILDDLERIDPEHIFRILNVFSAHLGLQNEELPNKFSFDKVILVADVQNLKSIFHCKYGEQTDFNGYFDKFFSEEIFEFKNEEIIAKYVDEIISRFQAENKLSQSLKNKSYFLQIILKDILLKSLKLDGKEKLNLRQLLKGIKFQLPALKGGSYKEGFMHTRDQGMPQIINIGIKTLISIFGGIDIDFISVLRKIRDNVSDKEDTSGHLGHYRTLSYYLLKSVSPFEETGDNLSHGWREYSIKIANKEIKSVDRRITKRGLNTTTSTRADVSGLFFDLLIEYVLREFYNKQVELI